jgi:hypothetical protein
VATGGCSSLISVYCLHFAYYNFWWVHKTLLVTPAMEAGITARYGGRPIGWQHEESN